MLKKKVLFILIVVTLLFITSCNNSGSGNSNLATSINLNQQYDDLDILADATNTYQFTTTTTGSYTFQVTDFLSDIGWSVYNLNSQWVGDDNNTPENGTLALDGSTTYLLLVSNIESYSDTFDLIITTP